MLFSCTAEVALTHHPNRWLARTSSTVSGSSDTFHPCAAARSAPPPLYRGHSPSSAASSNMIHRSEATTSTMHLSCQHTARGLSRRFQIVLLPPVTLFLIPLHTTSIPTSYATLAARHHRVCSLSSTTWPKLVSTESAAATTSRLTLDSRRFHGTRS